MSSTNDNLENNFCKNINNCLKGYKNYNMEIDNQEVNLTYIFL